MKELIDKSAILTEIDEIVKGLQKNCNPNPMGNIQECLAAAQIEALNLIKDFLDTLETKEVDLEEALSDLDKDIKEFVTTEEFEKDSAIYGHYWAIAKHAFLLGLKTKKGE